MTLCQSIFMQLARTEAKFFGMASLPLVEIPHHPSGGARPDFVQRQRFSHGLEHRADAEGAIESVGKTLTLNEVQFKNAVAR